MLVQTKPEQKHTAIEHTATASNSSRNQQRRAR